MLAAMTRYWWVFLLRGIVGILFAVLAWTQPGITIATLILVVGAYFLADGILALISGISGRGGAKSRGMLFLEAALGIGLGALTLYNPQLTGVALITYIAFWAMLTGAIEVYVAWKIRDEIEGEGWLIAAGVVSILFGIMLIVNPGAGALALLWLMAGYSFCFGILLVLLSFQLKKAKGRLEARPA